MKYDDSPEYTEYLATLTIDIIIRLFLERSSLSHVMGIEARRDTWLEPYWNHILFFVLKNKNLLGPEETFYDFPFLGIVILTQNIRNTQTQRK